MHEMLSEMAESLKDVVKASEGVSDSLKKMALAVVNTRQSMRGIGSIPAMTGPVGGIAFYRPRYGSPEPKEPFKKRPFSRKARKWADHNPERLENGEHYYAPEEILGERAQLDWRARSELFKRLEELRKMDAVTKLAQLT